MLRKAKNFPNSLLSEVLPINSINKFFSINYFQDFELFSDFEKLFFNEKIKIVALKEIYSFNQANCIAKCFICKHAYH